MLHGREGALVTELNSIGKNFGVAEVNRRGCGVCGNL